MKSLITILMLLLAGCASTPQRAQLLTSADGHTVIFKAMPDADRVALLVDWPSDWSANEQHNPATAQLATQLVMEGGSLDKGAAEMAEAFSQIGARRSLWSSFDAVRGMVQVKSKDVLVGAELMNQALRAPAFEQRWLDRVARNRRASQIESKELSSSLIGKTLSHWVLENNRQRQFIFLDDEKLYTDVKTNDLKAWHRRTLGVDGVLIAVTGDISKRKALAAAEQLLEGLPRTAAAQTEAIDTNFAAVDVLLHKAGAEKTSLALIAPLPSLQKTSALDAMGSMILGEGSESRLIKAIRDELRASYSFSSFQSGYDERSRYLVLNGEVAADKLKAVRQAALNAYRDLLEVGPTAEELQKNKKILLRRLNESTKFAAASMAGVLIDYQRFGWSIHQPEEEIKLLENLDLQTLQAHLKSSWPSSDKLITIAVSADADALDNVCVIERPAEVSSCR